MQLLQQVLVAVFPALVIVAALKDVTSFTIPNWLNGVIILCFFPAALAAGLPLAEFGAHFGVGIACLIAGMAMFAVNWIGGGDAKLFAAAGLWLGPTVMVEYVIITALAGGALALFLINLRADWARAMIPTGPGWVERLREPRGNAPYGVAISAGALAAFPQSTLLLAALS